MITPTELQKLINVLNNEKNILQNDLKIYQETMRNIFDLEKIEINGKVFILLEELVKICQNNFKQLSSATKK